MTSSTGNPQIVRVPTHVITGFLGVGKTSAILHLLRNKPASERWAVLVNEFGEIGVDGELFQGQYTEQGGVFIRELPGGCMCCAAGVPMQVVLNQLLARARPDRLLIEPTGLGHPAEVVEVLTEDHYHEVLALQKVVTLVDARKLKDERYTGHETFNQQISIADLIVGNKRDLYQPEDEAALERYARQVGKHGVTVLFTEQGVMDLSWLEGRASRSLTSCGHSHNAEIHLHAEPGPSTRHAGNEDDLLPKKIFPAFQIASAINEGAGYRSIGWRFPQELRFDYKKLYLLLSGMKVERMKAVFITDRGQFGFNLTLDALSQHQLDGCTESRVEIINDTLDAEWERALLDCLI
ncbi:CobW family GTP-binding protein [Ketobacter sp.]|uniref:CobW family GTP-binding protein n=1 Tax=Ketobacter sp. TaxID=2083498 RepID=UPI000F2519FF|nr:GTP-binding protein [Ketobacter sp.]RLU00652.1 MAG: GTP-binding protein [Ketobacter sp.]